MPTPSSPVAIIRPTNSLMVGFAVIVGITVASPSQSLTLMAAVGFLTGFLVSSYAMVINDLYDLEVDKINAPHRPLPSGAITPANAKILAVLLLLFGLATSTLTGQTTLVIAGTFALLAWIYNSWGKRQGLIGNTMVAASIAIPFIYGSAAVDQPTYLLVWLLALTSFLAGTGREVVKSIADVAGDQMRKVKSIARVKGPKAAARLGALFFGLAIFTTPLPILTHLAGYVYGTLVLIPNIIFVHAIIKLLQDHSPTNARKIKTQALIGMLIGLLAFLAGGVGNV